MRFVVYLDEEGSTWPPRKTAPGQPVVLDADPATRLDDAAAQAIGRAGPKFLSLYFVGEQGPVYNPRALLDASEEPPRLTEFPRAVPDESGEILWTEGARSRVTLLDLQRAKERGFFRGDPTGIFLERPMYGEAPPGWHELISWLADVGGVIGLAGLLVEVIRKLWQHWKDRGAITPFAFLDLVLARDRWDERELRELLHLSEAEAADLLTSFGYVRDKDAQTVWVKSDDPERSALRRRIIRDWLHRTDEDPRRDGD